MPCDTAIGHIFGKYDDESSKVLTADSVVKRKTGTARFRIDAPFCFLREVGTIAVLLGTIAVAGAGTFLSPVIGTHLPLRIIFVLLIGFLP